MTQALIIHGTAQEIATQLQGIHAAQQLTLIVPQAEPEDAAQAEHHFYLLATPEQFEEAFDALGRGKETAPQLPPEAFDRERLYDEERF